MQFGGFHHGGAPLGQQIEERLCLIEAYDRGFMPIISPNTMARGSRRRRVYSGSGRCWGGRERSCLCWA